MLALGHHLVLRLQDDRVIAPSAASRRKWARRMAELATAFPILAWCLADTHLHILVLGDRATAEELVRRLRIWVTRGVRPGVPLEVQRTKPIADQSHLEASFHYVLRQASHHGVATDPTHVASALPDLLGLRSLCPDLASRVREHMPRLTRGDLLRHLPADSLEEELHPEYLADAARAVFALDALDDGLLAVRARRAAVAAARELGPATLARLLDVERSTTWRGGRRDASASDVRAVRLQMALHARAAG